MVNPNGKHGGIQSPDFIFDVDGRESCDAVGQRVSDDAEQHGTGSVVYPAESNAQPEGVGNLSEVEVHEVEPSGADQHCFCG